MKDKILKKLDQLISEANDLFKNLNNSDLNEAYQQSKFTAFKTSCVSFLKTIVGGDLYFQKFNNGVKYHNDYNLVLAIELLKKVRADVDDGWLDNLKGLVSAELFADFLDMAEHLLDEGYKDPAAVIIGSVLEENLRQLSLKNGLPIEQLDSKNNKMKPMKAESLNIELAKQHVYNLLNQKSVTAWLDLRNKAAHGLYGEYDLMYVKSFLQFVRDFAARYN